MEIIFDINSNIFKGKSQVQIKNKLPIYKQYYKQIFKDYINELFIDEKYIKTIKFLHDAPKYGIIDKYIENKNLCFNIQLTDKYMRSFVQNPATYEEEQAKAIFQHELFHCKDFIQIYSNSSITSNPNPFQKDFHVNTMYNYLYDEGMTIWSEFYAFYENYKINPVYEVYDIIDDINKLKEWICIFKAMKKLNKTTYNLPEDFFADIHKFWYKMVSLTAIYIQTNKKSLVEEFFKYENELFFQSYFELICINLKSKLVSYPNWVSEENFIDFGKILFKIFLINDLYFSTDDLSDNLTISFIPIKIKKLSPMDN